MKKKSKIRIKIEFEQEDTQANGHEMTIDMLDEEMLDIDACEQKLLSVSYETMRLALSSHFSNLSKKKEQSKLPGESLK